MAFEKLDDKRSHVSSVLVFRLGSRYRYLRY